VGSAVGIEEMVGEALGHIKGVGRADIVGFWDGASVGWFVGDADGEPDGESVGDPEGDAEGDAEGDVEGKSLGLAVG